MEAMRLAVEIREAPHDRSCVPEQRVGGVGDVFRGGGTLPSREEAHISHGPPPTSRTRVPHGITVGVGDSSGRSRGQNGWDRGCCCNFCSSDRCTGLLNPGCGSCICCFIGCPGVVVSVIKVFLSLFINFDNPPEVGRCTLESGRSKEGGRSSLGRGALLSSSRGLLFPGGLLSVSPGSFLVEWFADRVRGGG